MRPQLCTTNAENPAAEKAHAPQRASLRLCPLPSPPTPPPGPGARTQLLVPSPHPCSCGPRPKGDPKRAAYATLTPLPEAHSNARSRAQFAGRPPPGCPRGGVCRPPAAASQLGQTKPRAPAAGAERANAPGTRAGRGGAAAGGNAREPPARVRARRRRGHSLDEVAGALLREALLPAAGQVCGDARKVRVTLGRPGAPPLRRPRAHLSGSCGRS